MICSTRTRSPIRLLAEVGSTVYSNCRQTIRETRDNLEVLLLTFFSSLAKRKENPMKTPVEGEKRRKLTHGDGGGDDGSMLLDESTLNW